VRGEDLEGIWRIVCFAARAAVFIHQFTNPAEAHGNGCTTVTDDGIFRQTGVEGGHTIHSPGEHWAYRCARHNATSANGAATENTATGVLGTQAIAGRLLKATKRGDMSNFLAIATVTEALRQMLDAAVGRDVSGGARATAVRPTGSVDGSSDGLPDVGVNVYLYQVSPNHSWRNADLPTRRGDCTMIQRPRAALIFITF
jgi:hypothetical protein